MIFLPFHFLFQFSVFIINDINWNNVWVWRQADDWLILFITNHYFGGYLDWFQTYQLDEISISLDMLMYVFIIENDFFSFYCE